MRLFDGQRDYELFIRCLIGALAYEPIPLYAYCVMPNHFHLVVQPDRDRQLADFMRHLAGSHGQLWQRSRGSIGGGAVYQGRYRACPVQTETHFLTVCRYVERNALRAGLVERAEAWPWGSAGMRGNNCDVVPLAAWPILRPSAWTDIVNGSEVPSEATAIRRCTWRGLPLGDATWQARMGSELGLESKQRRGRPPKARTENGVGPLFT